MKQLFIEALAVGIISMLIGFVISTSVMYLTQPDFELKKYNFWKSVLLTFFISGVATHFLFEMIGANKWYCTHGNACVN